MARPLRIEYPGAIYHVTARGNGRRVLFMDDEDMRRFLTLVDKIVELRGWVVHAYCLMGNHYHLLVETPQPNLSIGMRGLNGEYSQGFNRRHRRCGHLFQGRFKAVLVEKQTHLLELCRYIVLNPVRARGLRIAQPDDWQWSSYQATAGLCPRPKFLSTDWVLCQFGRRVGGARKGYTRFVQSGMKGRMVAPKPTGGLVLGSTVYLEKIHRMLEGRDNLEEHTLEQRFVGRPSLKEIIKETDHTNKSAFEKAIAEAYSRHGYRLGEIGDHVGMHYSTVSKIVKKCRESETLHQIKT